MLSEVSPMSARYLGDLRGRHAELLPDPRRVEDAPAELRVGGRGREEDLYPVVHALRKILVGTDDQHVVAGVAPACARGAASRSSDSTPSNSTPTRPIMACQVLDDRESVFRVVRASPCAGPLYSGWKAEMRSCEAPAKSKTTTMASGFSWSCRRHMKP